jgi:hypothetical protein
MRTLLLLVVVALASGAAFTSRAVAQTTTPSAASDMSAAEKALIEGSREAILQTGISAVYFDEHFRVARVIAEAGDRRVVWRFSVGGYDTTVSDTVGFYTDGGRRFDTHSVASSLASTYDITRTITRRRAEARLRRCLGRFTNAQVEYRAHGADGRAALLLTAQSIIKPKAVGPREASARRLRHEHEERERRERARRGTANGVPVDEIEAEGDEEDHPVILLGAVDLVTGKCVVGRARLTP